ncbi:MAG TPA: DUF2157 domain-containing protein [Croceibacterium sp.]
MSERKLKAWEAAGLIDGDTAARIRQWEDEHARPLALWAVFGIAALAIGLGVLSVVAANWDDIPGIVRLSLHFALMAGLAAFLWLRASSLAERQPWLHEAALFILGALGLTFMGHVGQVYQTSSPLWQPLALWLVLFGPLLLLHGLSWLTAATIAVTLVFTGWNYAIEANGGYGEEFSETIRTVRASLAVSVAILLAGLGAAQRRRSARQAFWITIERLGLTYALGLASLAIVVCAFETFTKHDDAGTIFLGLATGALVASLSALAVWRARPARTGEAVAGVLLGAALAVLLGFVLSGSQLAAGVLFMALWTGVAFAALHAGSRGVFQVAVGVVAVRLIVLSFELASDLLFSGVGLIVSGLLVLGIAFAAVRVSKTFAPVTGEPA